MTALQSTASCQTPHLQPGWLLECIRQITAVSVIALQWSSTCAQNFEMQRVQVSRLLCSMTFAA